MTVTKEQIEAALADLKYGRFFNDISGEILFALKFTAIALGEPTDNHCIDIFENKSRLKAVERSRVFKTMIAQIAKEAGE